MTAYLHRELAPELLAALEDMPVVVITGMRKTGKNTLLQNETALQKRRYVRLDDFAMLRAHGKILNHCWKAARRSPSTKRKKPRSCSMP